MVERGMETINLRHDQWHKIERFLNENPNVHVGKRMSSLYRRGAVAAEKRSTVATLAQRLWELERRLQFDSWSEKGVWQDLFEHLAAADMERLMLDSSVIRAHACAGGASEEKGDKNHKL